MKRPSLLLILALAFPLTAADPTPAGTPEDGIFETEREERPGGKMEWTISFAGKAERRAVTFRVTDAACAVELLGDPDVMVEAVPFLHKAVASGHSGNQYELALTERFFLVGDAHSRYRRTVQGQKISWVLLEGRALRHDGTWTVKSTPDGPVVHFVNVIEAKNFLHQALLNGIQKRSMGIIVDATQERCGAGVG